MITGELLEVGILGLLAANADVQALVPASRFYADSLPRKVTYPAAVHHMGIGGRVKSTLDGRDSQSVRFQIDFAEQGTGKHRDVVKVRDAVVNALHNFKGTMPGGGSVKRIAYVQPVKLPYDDDKQVDWVGAEFSAQF